MVTSIISQPNNIDPSTVSPQTSSTTPTPDPAAQQLFSATVQLALSLSIYLRGDIGGKNPPNEMDTYLLAESITNWCNAYTADFPSAADPESQAIYNALTSPGPNGGKSLLDIANDVVANPAGNWQEMSGVVGNGQFNQLSTSVSNWMHDDGAQELAVYVPDPAIESIIFPELNSLAIAVKDNNPTLIAQDLQTLCESLHSLSPNDPIAHLLNEMVNAPIFTDPTTGATASIFTLANSWSAGTLTTQQFESALGSNLGTIESVCQESLYILAVYYGQAG